MVMRPRGPLPPRIYWTRRMLIAAVIVLLLGFVWWLVPTGSPGSAAAEPDAGTTTTPAGGPTTPATTAPRSPTGTPGGTITQSHQTSPPQTSAPPLSQPTGPCDPAKIALGIDVKDAVWEHGTAVRLRMSTTDASTCTLGITPHVLELRIVSDKGDTMWRSSSCPDGLAAKNVVVRPTAAVVYTFGWDGRESPDACSSGKDVAAIGSYQAEAALIGGEPALTAFAVNPAPSP